MKKRFIYICSVFAMMLVCNSCGDQLELLPQDAIATEIGLLNQTDFENASKGLYTGFRRNGYYGGGGTGASSLYFVGDIITDNCIINSQGRRSGETFYDLRYDEDSAPTNFWLSAYKVIQRANLMLENIDNLDDGPIKDNAKGEALAARGIAHFDLLRMYADSPANPRGNNMGIPYVTSTDSSLEPARDDVGACYTNVLADLNEAAGLINADNGSGRLNKNAISALLSRVHLFMGDYQSALTAANAVTGSVVTRSKYQDIWLDESDDGVIWSINITDPDGISVGVTWLQESPDGIRSEYNIDFAFLGLFDNNDIRRETWIETSDFAGETYNHMVKYRGRDGGNANVVNAKVIRYAEVVLNRAEAMYETGDEAGALAALDELRSERYDGFSSGGETGQSLLSAIYNERRLELAFEGDRFFFLKRKGINMQRSTFGDLADGSGIEAEFQFMDANDHRWNMPIGETEIDANQSMVQNPGY